MFQQWFGHLDLDSERPCSESNPVLWAVYCATQRRPLKTSIPPVWTEIDVLTAIGAAIEEAHNFTDNMRLMAAKAGSGHVH